jgi:prolipoprotein diacylglyceryltransferase
MNIEIYGAPTDLPWGFIFVRDGQTEPCHPTQIYEMIYCLVALAITWPLYWKTEARRREGLLLGIFLNIIFITRFCLEFIKNDQEAFEANHILNMGQILSIPFILLGTFLIIRAYKKPMLPVIETQPESLEPKYQSNGNQKTKKQP